MSLLKNNFRITKNKGKVKNSLSRSEDSGISTVKCSPARGCCVLLCMVLMASMHTGSVDLMPHLIFTLELEI